MNKSNKKSLKTRRKNLKRGKKSRHQKSKKSSLIYQGNKGTSSRVTKKPVMRSKTIRNKGLAVGMRIQHREYVDTIIANGTDLIDISTYEVNPGLQTMFAWLSGICRNYESYKWNSLRWSYINDVGANTNGSIMVIPDYDGKDDLASYSKQQLAAFQDSVRGPVWDSHTCYCTKKNLQKRKTYFIRHSEVTDEKRLFDALQLAIVTTGFTSETELGELWVEYDISLMTPQLGEQALDAAIVDNQDTVLAYQPFQKYTTGSGMKLAGNSGLEVVDDGSYNKIKVDKPGKYLLSGTTLLKTGGTPTSSFDITQPTVDASSPEGCSVSTLTNQKSVSTGYAYQKFFFEAGKLVSKVAPMILEWTGFDNTAAAIVDTLGMVTKIANDFIDPLQYGSWLTKTRHDQAMKKLLKAGNTDDDINEAYASGADVSVSILKKSIWIHGTSEAVSEVKDGYINKGHGIIEDGDNSVYMTRRPVEMPKVIKKKNKKKRMKNITEEQMMKILKEI